MMKEWKIVLLCSIAWLIIGYFLVPIIRPELTPFECGQELSDILFVGLGIYYVVYCFRWAYKKKKV